MNLNYRNCTFLNDRKVLDVEYILGVLEHKTIVWCVYIYIYIDKDKTNVYMIEKS